MRGKGWLIGLLLALSPWAWADGIDDATLVVPIEVDAAEVDDEDVPVFLIKASDLPPEFWAALAVRGDTTCGTCRWANADGTVEYPIHVLDTFDTVGEDGGIFVRATGMSASVNVAYSLYVGSPTASMYAADSTYGSEAVWAGFAAAWTLTGSSPLTDVTGGGYDLAATNTPTAGAAGPVEGLESYDFASASSQYLSDTASPLSGLPMTIISFFASDDDTILQFVAGLANSGGLGQNTARIHAAGDVTGNPIQARFRGAGGTTTTGETSSGFVAGVYTMGAAVRAATTGSASIAYKDGANAGSDSSDITAFAGLDRIVIGARADGANAFDGKISLTLFDDEALSADYLATLYRAITSATFYDVGAAVELGNATDWVEFTSVLSAVGWINASNALTNLGTAAEDEDVPVEETTAALQVVDVDGGLDEILGGTVTGIAVELVAQGGIGSGQEMIDESIRLIVGGSVVGSNLAAVLDWSNGMLVTAVYGGPGELWGLTPVDTDLTANDFGVSVQFLSDGINDSSMEVYRIRVKVYYEPAVVTSAGNFFLLF